MPHARFRQDFTPAKSVFLRLQAFDCACRIQKPAYKYVKFIFNNGCIVRKYFKTAVFTQNCEAAHDMALKAMQVVGAIPPLRAAMEYFSLVKAPKPIKVFGLDFPNRVGLAAGFDKDAKVFRAASAFGFGHVEIGTISMLKQAGNPRPRMFRYPQQEAVVNACGFPNDGAEQISKRLADMLGGKKGRANARLE